MDKELLQRFDNMEKKIELILQLLQHNQKTDIRVIEHIDFIENIYGNVKKPLDFVCNNINNFIECEKDIKDK